MSSTAQRVGYAAAAAGRRGSPRDFCHLEAADPRPVVPVWIGLAMVTGLLLGRTVPGLNRALDAVQVHGISLPIAIGLLVMMYPVLAKVRYDRLDTVTRDTPMRVSSLVLNWLVGPALMFALAWLLLPDLPEYRTGLIIVAFAGLGWFYLSVLPGWLGLPQAGFDVSAWQIAVSVIIFLGVPLLAGCLSRRVGEKRWGRTAYENSFLPRIGPWALYGLLFTIVILFALQGDQITSRPWDVARIALPLLAYFGLMWGGGTLLGRARHVVCPHDDSCVHCRRQQLRARHCRCHRNLRGHVGAGACRRRRSAHRGAGSRRPRPCQSRHPPPLPARGDSP